MMKQILTLTIGVSMLLPQVTSAAPKEKYKPIPPGHYRSSRYHSGHRYPRPTVDVYRHWNRGRIYTWNNHRYRWYGGAWVIYDASPRAVYSQRAVGGSVVASVQAALNRRGYDAGPVDGAMGGRTRSAIYAFQADHGLSRTGTINESLLRALRLD